MLLLLLFGIVNKLTNKKENTTFYLHSSPKKIIFDAFWIESQTHITH